MYKYTNITYPILKGTVPGKVYFVWEKIVKWACETLYSNDLLRPVFADLRVQLYLKVHILL